MSSEVDTQARELRQKAQAEIERKSAKLAHLSEKFAKLSDKLAQTEAARKAHFEKLKEEEKTAKGAVKELAGLRERNEQLSRENAELRKERVLKERALMDRVKKAERELERAGAKGAAGGVAEGRVSWDEEARDIIDREWEQFRAQEKGQ